MTLTMRVAAATDRGPLDHGGHAGKPLSKEWEGTCTMAADTPIMALGLLHSGAAGVRGFTYAENAWLSHDPPCVTSTTLPGTHSLSSDCHEIAPQKSGIAPYSPLQEALSQKSEGASQWWQNHYWPHIE